MLKKIQAQPEHIRQKISLALTIVIFGGIAFVWLSSWNARTTSDDSREKTASPTESFKEIFAGMISEVKSSISSSSFSGEEKNISANTASPDILQRRVATSTTFDMSGVVIIDLATSTIKK